MAYKNIKGERYGRLEVIEHIGTRRGKHYGSANVTAEIMQM